MKKTFAALLALAILTTASGAFSPLHAQTSPANDGLMPPVSPKSAVVPSEESGQETHPAMKMMPDKSELVRLPREASSVIIGNQDHIGVVLDTPKLAVVIPRTPGATYFTILDKDGEVIMQRHVIVAAPKKNYVRVRRSCGNAPQGASCQPTSVYFCPDMCHEVGAGSGGNADAPANSNE